MAISLFTKQDITNGQTITVPLGTGGYCSGRFYNTSPYVLIIGNSQNYDHSRYYDTMVDRIEPWSVTPVDMTVWPKKVWVTMDSQFDPIFTNDPYLTSLSGVEVAQYQTPLASYTPINLLPRSALTTTGSVQPGVGANPIVATDIGVGMVRDLASGTFLIGVGTYTLKWKITSVSQVYLQNNGSALIYVWGDEIGFEDTPPSSALTLNPGDSLGLAWATQKVYAYSAQSSQSLQIQGWYA